MMTYLKIAALVGLVVIGYWFSTVLQQNKELKSENEIMTLQIEKTAENVKLLVQHLDREIEYRQIAESALNGLAYEVPDVVYSQELPPEIQNVLDRFHSDIRDRM